MNTLNEQFGEAQDLPDTDKQADKCYPQAFEIIYNTGLLFHDDCQKWAKKNTGRPEELLQKPHFLAAQKDLRKQ
jgi:hypothetical protein